MLAEVIRLTQIKRWISTATEVRTGLTQAQQEKREKFWTQEKIFEASVQLDHLSDEEKAIHRAHAEAVQRLHFTYNDPVTGERHFTRYRHFLKGACCGSACRHCIYDHEKVPDIKKRARRFNTAFWVYDEDCGQPDDDERMRNIFGV